jgi:hypothetical protein
MEFSDVVISVLPSTISKEAVGKHLKVKLIQKEGYLQCPVSMQEFILVDDQLIERGPE